jgi:pantothenate kinase
MSSKVEALSVKATRSLVVNGLRVEVTPDVSLMDEVLVPALERVAAGGDGRRRSYVFLAAPPATGKSVLATLLVQQARHLDVDAVGIDGFHYPQTYLESTLVDTDSGRVPLASYKGAPDTFDTAALGRCLRLARTRDIAWPVYDRVVHDVVPDAQTVTAGLVVVEGNWLLLDDPRWAPLAAHSSLNVFIDADPHLLRDRLIERKVRGGASRAEAVAFYERSDRHNVTRVLEGTDRSKVDLLLRLHPDGSLTHVESRRNES